MHICYVWYYWQEDLYITEKEKENEKKDSNMVKVTRTR